MGVDGCTLIFTLVSSIDRHVLHPEYGREEGGAWVGANENHSHKTEPFHWRVESHIQPILRYNIE